MAQDELLQLDETALCFFRRLQLLYDDAHAWFQNSRHDPHDSEKFFRLQDISAERDQVSLDLCEHIAYVLLSDSSYKRGIPGISLEDALLIKLCISRMSTGMLPEEAHEQLHDILRALEIIL